MEQSRSASETRYRLSIHFHFEEDPPAPPFLLLLLSSHSFPTHLRTHTHAYAHTHMHMHTTKRAHTPEHASTGKRRSEQCGATYLTRKHSHISKTRLWMRWARLARAVTDLVMPVWVWGREGKVVIESRGQRHRTQMRRTNREKCECLINGTIRSQTITIHTKHRHDFASNVSERITSGTSHTFSSPPPPPPPPPHTLACAPSFFPTHPDCCLTFSSVNRHLSLLKSYSEISIPFFSLPSPQWRGDGQDANANADTAATSQECTPRDDRMPARTAKDSGATRL